MSGFKLMLVGQVDFVQSFDMPFVLEVFLYEQINQNIYEEHFTKHGQPTMIIFCGKQHYKNWGWMSRSWRGDLSFAAFATGEEVDNASVCRKMGLVWMSKKSLNEAIPDLVEGRLAVQRIQRNKLRKILPILVDFDLISFGKDEVFENMSILDTQILDLLAKGQSSRVVAKELQIDPSTVSRRMKNLRAEGNFESLQEVVIRYAFFSESFNV